MVLLACVPGFIIRNDKMEPRRNIFFGQLRRKGKSKISATDPRDIMPIRSRGQLVVMAVAVCLLAPRAATLKHGK